MKNILPITWGTDFDLVIKELEKTGKYHALRPDEYGFGHAGMYWANLNLPKIHAEHNFELVMVPDEVRAWIKPMIGWCKQKGIPVVLCMGEALASDYNAKSWEADQIMSDHICLGGQKQKDIFMEYGVSEDRITITGQPIFDIYVNKSKYTREELFETMGLDINKKTILYTANFAFASIPKERIEAGEKPYEKMMYSTLKVVCEYVKDHDDTQAIVKLHPQQTRDERTAYSEIISKYDIDNRIVLRGGVGDNLDPQSWHMFPHIDVEIGFETTCIAECFLYDKPTIQTLFYGEADIPEGIVPYYESLTSFGAFNKEHLYNEIYLTLNTIRKPRFMEKARKEFIKYNFYKVDGESAKRVANVIKRMIK